MTSLRADRELIGAIRALARPLEGGPRDFDPLLRRIGDARFVLLGEATHGTHDFYRVRAEITKRLIRELGFTAVVVEADWPDAYRVNRYVRGTGTDSTAEQALRDFRRFPQWMWRNADVLDFVGWLRAFNERQPPEAQVGFYGMDLYSLHASMEAVMRFLRKVDPEAAHRAARRYGCFGLSGDDPQRYGYAASLGLSASCEAEVVAQLVELRASAAAYARRNGRLAADDPFYAEQNARVVANAERYYRAMFGNHVSSWNVRDRHMTDTLGELAAFLEREGRPARLVVWAHNSHLGDARATTMGEQGEENVGQLVRQRFGSAVLIGFTTFTGTVTAARDWDEPAERRTVRPALPESYEALFHLAGGPNFHLDLSHPPLVPPGLDVARLQRAIGVIYRPESERWSHYFHARLPHQFDHVLHYDVTRAVEPLERTAAWETGEVPETFPSGV